MVLLTRVDAIKGITRTVNFKSITRKGNSEDFAAVILLKYLVGFLAIVGGVLKAVVDW